MTRRRRRVRGRGQSLVEFTLIVPIMLTLVGATLDFARLFQAWITLQGATRDAAEYAATNATDPSSAQAAAVKVVCEETQSLTGFVPGNGGKIDSCTSPAVSVAAWSRSTSSPGTSDNPVASVTVHAQLAFAMLFPYPFLDRGTWNLTSEQSYTILQYR